MPITDSPSAKRANPDYYQVLGIWPMATVEQIKAAYHRQAHKYHPDKNSDSPLAAEQFKLCNEAYQTLSDASRRTSYDRETLFGRNVQEIAREIIGELLNRNRKRPVAGRDLRYTLELTFREAALGLERRIRFEVFEPCATCEGGGAAPGGTRRCAHCNGRGEEPGRQGLFALPRPCGQCGGQGFSITQPCPACGGVGTNERTRDYLVRLLPGVQDGEVKVVRRQGEPGLWGGMSGDLLINLKVTPDPLLSLEGADLVVHVPLAFSLAAMGGFVEVPTLEGRARMKIPAGTQAGRTFRLRGLGAPGAKGRGDLLVRVQVETPIKLSALQRRLILKFEESLTPEMQPLQDGYLEEMGVDHS